MVPTLLRRVEPCVAVAAAVVLFLGRWRLPDCAVVKGRQTRVVCAPVAWRDEETEVLFLTTAPQKHYKAMTAAFSAVSVGLCLSVSLYLCLSVCLSV